MHCSVYTRINLLRISDHMNIKNFEFKARVDNTETYENKLLALNPRFAGVDHQVDTYFNVSKGRLKLREGNIENALIYYERENVADAKRSDIILFRFQPAKALKEILTMQLGIKVVVDKLRKIYFINNIKFHFDTVNTLGNFIEVEAIDDKGDFTTQQLQQQCDQYFNFFELDKLQLVDKSYSDLIEAMIG